MSKKKINMEVNKEQDGSMPFMMEFDELDDPLRAKNILNGRESFINPAASKAQSNNSGAITLLSAA